MKKGLTIYVPDDCYLKMVNLVVLVEKEDKSTSGCTVFTLGKEDLKQKEWLFVCNDKAVPVDKAESEDVPDINNGNIYVCPCGYGWDKSKVVRHHFCPNCGAKVVEPTLAESEG